MRRVKGEEAVALGLPKKEKKGKPEGLPHKKREWSLMIKKEEISANALKLIKKMDELEVKVADLEDEIAELFPEIVRALGHPTFEHPERGAMTIMFRGSTWFWRSKPAGRPRWMREKRSCNGKCVR